MTHGGRVKTRPDFVGLTCPYAGCGYVFDAGAVSLGPVAGKTAPDATWTAITVCSRCKGVFVVDYLGPRTMHKDEVAALPAELRKNLAETREIVEFVEARLGKY